MDNNEFTALVNECAEAVGYDPRFILFQVLGHFPDLARQFIKTQQHAATIMGHGRIWYIVTHKSGGTGADGTEYFPAGANEYFDPLISGELIGKMISVIEHLRGVGDMGLFPFYFNDMAERLLEAVNPAAQENCEAAVIRKVIEVMEVSDEELGLIRESAQAKAAETELNKEIQRLETEMAALKQRAADGIRMIQEKINVKYPRAMPISK